MSGGESRNRTGVDGFAIRCINHFAISPNKLPGSVQTGAGNESRTRDLNLGKVALYQLSYSRIAKCAERWSGKRVSNSRPQPWQGCALPTELFPHGTHLKLNCGAGNESRTRDLNLGKVALYQLSYSRIGETL